MQKATAFTLVELLAALAIIGTLAAVGTAAFSNGHAMANHAKCLSNQRQIGLALLSYANEEGIFPPTTHSTGTFRRERSWIFQLAPYLGNEPGEMDKVRICPAEPAKRKEIIRQRNSTSYVLNDLVFDSPVYHRPIRIPLPSRTLLLMVLSESRAPSTSRDHIHGAEWTSWTAALNDIEPDRHRVGGRSSDRLKGKSNYLFADGHVASIPAKDFKNFFDRGINPAAVPEK